jgi:hypothetical protein
MILIRMPMHWCKSQIHNTVAAVVESRIDPQCSPQDHGEPSPKPETRKQILASTMYKKYIGKERAEPRILC